MHWPCTAGHGVCPCVWVSWAVRSCERKLIFPLEAADSGRKLLSHTQGCVHLLRPVQALCMRSQSEWVRLCLSLLCFLGVCLSLCPYNPPVAPSPMLLSPMEGLMRPLQLWCSRVSHSAHCQLWFLFVPMFCRRKLL